MQAGEPVPVPRPVGTLADGMTPPFVGKLPLIITQKFVDRIVTVTEQQIADAMAALATRAKLYVEGSGAAATAALLSGAAEIPEGATVVSLVSGGNVDLDRFGALFTGGRDA
jgi:threonine dehydratase